MKLRIICGILILVIVAGCNTNNTNGNIPQPTGGKIVTIYKSPSCGCCVGYTAELERQGFQVEIVKLTDMSPIKQKYNIPRNMESCHTAVIEGYFVEGHVPIEAINEMLEEKPDIDGIALPDMPSGSPGMPGQKTKSWTIYSLSEGEPTEFITI